ncbi:hypothetical protein Tco_0307189 [Tanacetum coccineum]
MLKQAPLPLARGSAIMEESVKTNITRAGRRVAAIIGYAGRRVEAKAKLEANRERHLEAKLADHLEQKGADIIQTQGGKFSNPSNPGLSVATAPMAITTGVAGEEKKETVASAFGED